MLLKQFFFCKDHAHLLSLRSLGKPDGSSPWAPDQEPGGRTPWAPRQEPAGTRDHFWDAFWTAAALAGDLLAFHAVASGAGTDLLVGGGALLLVQVVSLGGVIDGLLVGGGALSLVRVGALLLLCASPITEERTMRISRT